MGSRERGAQDDHDAKGLADFEEMRDNRSLVGGRVEGKREVCQAWEGAERRPPRVLFSYSVMDMVEVPEELEVSETFEGASSKWVRYTEISEPGKIAMKPC